MLSLDDSLFNLPHVSHAAVLDLRHRCEHFLSFHVDSLQVGLVTVQGFELLNNLLLLALGDTLAVLSASDPLLSLLIESSHLIGMRERNNFLVIDVAELLLLV